MLRVVPHTYLPTILYKAIINYKGTIEFEGYSNFYFIIHTLCFLYEALFILTVLNRTWLIFSEYIYCHIICVYFITSNLSNNKRTKETIK